MLIYLLYIFFGELFAQIFILDCLSSYLVMGILDGSPLSDICFASIFCQSVASFSFFIALLWYLYQKSLTMGKVKMSVKEYKLPAIR